jgi:predicted helicase
MTKACIFYARVDEFWRKGEKCAYVEEKQHVSNIEWQELQPDAKHTWITEGLRTDFNLFIPTATKEAKQLKSDAEVIFKTFSLGVNTARDSVVYDFAKDSLLEKVAKFCDEYNAEVMR